MKIDNNWSVRPESNGGMVLVFAEKRIRKEGKSKGEEFIYEDLYYYPNVNSCLKAYLNKSLEEATDVKHCIELIESTYNRIAKLS